MSTSLVTSVILRDDDDAAIHAGLMKPKVYLRHGTKNETERIDLAETGTSDFIIKINP